MGVITTIKDKCQACYSCIRNCPVKAIKVEEGQAKVVDERCISCGNCVRVCAQGAKKITWDKEELMKNIREEKSIAIVAPSFTVSFPDVPFEQLKAALFKLGFNAVEEVTIGVNLTVQSYKKLLAETDKPVISSFCPAIVGFIEKHYPAFIENLAPIDSAMTATAKYVRKKYPEAKVIFIGPCIAKKEEALNQTPQLVNGVMTFKELKEVINEAKINITHLHFMEEEKVCNDANEFPLTGGLVKNLAMDKEEIDNQVAIIEGFDNCLEIIKDLDAGKIKPKLLDLLFCRGCIDGPEVDSSVPYFNRKKLIINRLQGRSCEIEEKYLPIDLRKEFIDRSRAMPIPSENEIKEILGYTYKSRDEDELDCGACGYSTCREKAVAVYQGLAEIDMCLPYLVHKSRGEVEYYRDRLQDKKKDNNYLDIIVGDSEEIHKIKKLIEKAARSEATILIQGESGVGKELVAKGIHYLSSRKDKPFIGINCTALPELLLESELFGYEEGAFTGARKGGKPGKFELANGGTILLDEIGDMPLTMQAKLLRVLQEKEVERIGGTKTLKLDIRIIAATNQDIKKLVQEGKFRVDLYYRLNVINFMIPALKERRADIPILVGNFIQKLAREKNLQPKLISEEALLTLKKYNWPGNIRELENVIERAMYIAEGSIIMLEHLVPSIQTLNNKDKNNQIRPFKDAVRELEAKLIKEALMSTNNNRVNAAILLGMPRATLYQKLREYNIK